MSGTSAIHSIPAARSSAKRLAPRRGRSALGPHSARLKMIKLLASVLTRARATTRERTETTGVGERRKGITRMVLPTSAAGTSNLSVSPRASKSATVCPADSTRQLICCNSSSGGSDMLKAMAL